LRTTIKKARIVYPKRIVDELYALTEDFGEYYLDVLKKEEYKSYFASETDPNGSKSKIYAEKIIPILYEKVENLLNDDLDLSQ
jgi:hypothetical protein